MSLQKTGSQPSQAVKQRQQIHCLRGQLAVAVSRLWFLRVQSSAGYHPQLYAVGTSCLGILDLSFYYLDLAA